MNEHDVPVLQPPSDLSAATLPLFERVTDAYPVVAGAGLVLDLTRLRTITSAGLSHLVRLGRRLDEQGGTLVLAGGSKPVLKLLRTVGLDTVFPHFKSVHEATAFVRGRGTMTP